MSATRMTRRDCLAATSALALLPLRAFATTQPPVKWTNVQALLDGYVAKRKYAAVAAALSFGGSPVAYPIAGTTLYGNRDGKVAVLDGGANSNWLKPARLPAGGGGLVRLGARLHPIWTGPAARRCVGLVSAS